MQPFDPGRVTADDVDRVANTPALDKHAVNTGFDLEHRVGDIADIVDAKSKFFGRPDREVGP